MTAMQSILTTFLGVLLGGFISWVLAYEYWRKQNAKIPVKASDHVTVELSPEKIWQIVTSPEFDFRLDWRGPYGAPPCLYKEHEVNNGLYKRKIYFQIVLEPYELAWGSDPSEWDHRLTLQPLEKGTRICLERVFWPYIAKWFYFILDGFKAPKGISSNYESVKSDIERIEFGIRECEKNRVKKEGGS